MKLPEVMSSLLRPDTQYRRRQHLVKLKEKFVIIASLCFVAFLLIFMLHSSKEEKPVTMRVNEVKAFIPSSAESAIRKKEFSHNEKMKFQTDVPSNDNTVDQDSDNEEPSQPEGDTKEQEKGYKIPNQAPKEKSSAESEGSADGLTKVVPVEANDDPKDNGNVPKSLEKPDAPAGQESTVPPAEIITELPGQLRDSKEALNGTEITDLSQQEDPAQNDDPEGLKAASIKEPSAEVVATEKSSINGTEFTSQERFKSGNSIDSQELLTAQNSGNSSELNAREPSKIATSEASNSTTEPQELTSLTANNLTSAATVKNDPKVTKGEQKKDPVTLGSVLIGGFMDAGKESDNLKALMRGEPQTPRVFELNVEEKKATSLAHDVKNVNMKRA
ncbi:hypothetical protein L596_009729 [Steinernema carpocapsae]|uniref:Uncharacterized protein n=1 Tax=Steinernema carpocapsae TaxID=34508 RepID=A0A4U5PGQ9_STECR|nr:hypothetical protein L596_009729 [Steinernema carpocapsae]